MSRRSAFLCVGLAFVCSSVPGQQQSGRAPSQPVPSGVERTGSAEAIPKLISKPEPDVTAQTADHTLQGSVLIAAEIGTDGVPRSTRIIHSLDPALDKKAADSVRDWRFEPVAKDDKPVVAIVRIEFDFRSHTSRVLPPIDDGWTRAGYEPHMAELTVAALAPDDLQDYRAGTDEKRLEYLGRKFPFIFRYDASAEGRHLLVNRGLPEADVAAYNRLPSTDEQVEFCLRKFGATGVVYTDQYRAWVRTQAALATGQKPALDNAGFQTVMLNHTNSQLGIDFPAVSAESKRWATAIFAFNQIPHPIFMDRVFTLALKKMYDEAEKAIEAKRPRPISQSALALITSLAGGMPRQKGNSPHVSMRTGPETGPEINSFVRRRCSRTRQRRS